MSETAATRFDRLRAFLRERRLTIVIGVIAVAAVVTSGVILAGRRDGGHSAGHAGPRLPRVIYLAPSNAAARNLYVSDVPTGPAQQLTFAEHGIEDFAVSPDGSQVAYAQNNADSTADIWVLDVTSRAAHPVTRCVDAMCTLPAWKPDGTQIAYQRQEFGGAGKAESTRAWIVDLRTLQTRLLFDDAQILGTDPTWSPDGRRVAVFDASVSGIRVHDFVTGSDTIIESAQDVVGNFSPDGTRLVYPVLVRGARGQEFYTHLEIADLEALTRTRLSGAADAPVEDSYAVWSPARPHLLVARRYLDARYTPGTQIYLLDLATGEATPLIVDAGYNHAGMHWDATGHRIVFQRFAVTAQEALPEVWVYDLDTKALTRVAENAFFPAWLP
jgi:dipeptidyl aminopeptidase/acylaminoacyl peptidase